MARIVIPTRPVRVPGPVDRPLHSRIVSCALSLFQAGIPGFTYTSIVGQNILLLNVDVWMSVNKPPNPQRIVFGIFTGFDVPVTIDDITRWDFVLPISEGDRVGTWGFCAGTESRHWQMAFPYTGTGRRFGVVAVPDANLTGCMTASFNVAEG